MNKITKIIREWNRNRSNQMESREVENTRNDFYIDEECSSIVIKHNGVVLQEFNQGSTQQVILEALNAFRDIAAKHKLSLIRSGRRY